MKEIIIAKCFGIFKLEPTLKVETNPLLQYHSISLELDVKLQEQLVISNSHLWKELY